MESSKKNTAQLIDIENVIKSKNPKLLKLLPKFIIRYIKKTLHQDELNGFLIRHGDKYGIDFTKACEKDFNLTIKTIGEENIPREGKYIFASNHPLGGLESIVLINIVNKYHAKVRFLVNDILLFVKNFDPLFIPINKHGGHSKEAAKKIEETYESDAQVLIFPAGLVSRKIDNQVIDLEWKKSFITKSIKHKRDIVPVFIEGQNSKFFYRLAAFRKAIGLKANLEMFYLPDEMLKQIGSTITIRFGKSIPYETFTKKLSPKEWAEVVKEITYSQVNR